MDKAAMRRTSMSSSGTTVDSENIRVYLRIRPFIDREDNIVNDSKPSSIIQVMDSGDGSVGMTVRISDTRFGTLAAYESESFTFDAVGGTETDQEMVFNDIAKPIANNCLLGYNGTIFAYGQTGSGKTFTMQGPINDDGSIDYERRGVIPRTVDYIFQRMREEERRSNGTLTYFCKCAYVEIYNEVVYDLLDLSGGTCTLREDSKRGVYVEGCKEEFVHNPHEAFMLYEEGSRNRHVAETAMNRESSRSHCVFIIALQSKKLDGAIVDVREARFNLVDLAGSERQQLTATVGARLKEAGNINKSLLALSNVINALVDIANGKNRHVHYRDSKLTFLLRDSLGGNSKTLIIAAVSPSPLCQAETLSTLRFAQRAKQIRNKAIVNKDIQGNVFELQAEVRRLRHENLLLKTTGTGHVNSTTILMGDDDTMNKTEDCLIWTVNYERLRELQADIDRLHRLYESSQALVQRREDQLKSEKMIAKFRETSIQTYENELVRKIQKEGDEGGLNLLEIFKHERTRYKTEISELKKQVENHPEVTKYAHELLELRTKIAKFDKQKIIDYEGKIEMLHRYTEELWKKLSCFEQQCAGLGNENVNKHTNYDGDRWENDIQTQELEGSADSLPGLTKDNGALHGRLPRPIQKDMENRYGLLLQEMELLRRELDERNKTNLFVETSIEFEEDPSLEFGKKRRVSNGSSRDSIDMEGLQVELEEKIDMLEEENKSLHNTLQLIKEEVQKESMASKSMAVDLCILQSQYREKLGQTENELAEATDKLEIALRDRNGVDIEKESLIQSVAVLRKALEEAEYHYRNATTVLQETKAELDNNQNLITALESQIAELTNQLQKYEPLKSFGASTDEIIRRIEFGDKQQSVLEQRTTKLEFHLQAAQQDNEDLLRQIRILTANGSVEKLAMAEATINSLHAELDGVREELVKLRQENDKLIQHRNIKQKLQYHVAIKEENNAFREEIHWLREELIRLKQKNIELEETVRSMST